MELVIELSSKHKPVYEIVEQLRELYGNEKTNEFLVSVIAMYMDSMVEIRESEKLDILYEWISTCINNLYTTRGVECEAYILSKVTNADGKTDANLFAVPSQQLDARSKLEVFYELQDNVDRQIKLLLKEISTDRGTLDYMSQNVSASDDINKLN